MNDDEENNKKLEELQLRFNELKSTGAPAATVEELENRLKILKGEIDKDGNEIKGPTANELFERFEKLTGSKPVVSADAGRADIKGKEEAADVVKTKDNTLNPLPYGTEDIMGLLNNSSYGDRNCRYLYDREPVYRR